MSHTVTTAGEQQPMPAEGTPFRRIRIDDDLWERFDEAVRRADPDSNRSVVLRKFTRWYVGDIDELPQRPASGKEKAAPEDGSSVKDTQ